MKSDFLCVDKFVNSSVSFNVKLDKLRLFKLDLRQKQKFT